MRTVAELWNQGMPAEEIPVRLPHLELAQVFDALRYYLTHREEIDPVQCCQPDNGRLERQHDSIHLPKNRCEMPSSLRIYLDEDVDVLLGRLLGQLGRRTVETIGRWT